MTSASLDALLRVGNPASLSRGHARANAARNAHGALPPPRRNGREPLADGRKHFGRATPAKLRNPRTTLHLQRRLKKRDVHVWWKGTAIAPVLLMWLLQWCVCLLWLLRWLWLSSWSTHALPWWCCWGLANFAHGRDKSFYQFQIETECDGKRGGIGGVISRPVWDQQRNKMLWQTRGIRRRNFQPVSDIQC